MWLILCCCFHPINCLIPCIKYYMLQKVKNQNVNNKIPTKQKNNENNKQLMKSQKSIRKNTLGLGFHI